MRNIGVIVIVVIYAVIYIVKLARKARPKAPPPRAGDIFPRAYDEDNKEEEKSVPAVHIRAPEPARLTAAVNTPAAAKPAGGDPKGGLFRRLEKMTPLARALVMSELLGKPKGTVF
ncbi:MAG: hypothetical protein LBD71_07395 [Treponema sp.]|jgi:hypothetical protein|nr:hypothetical protein [Treponema sp.]